MVQKYCVEWPQVHLTPLSACLTLLRSASRASMGHRSSVKSWPFNNGKGSSSTSSFVPSLRRRSAAADWFGRTAGDSVKRVSKDDVDRTAGVCRTDGEIEEMADEEDV